MNYIITYDITNDKIRNKIAGILEDYGVRVQYSVFECWLENDEKLNLLIKNLEETLDSNENGNIRIYTSCKDCFEKTIGIGETKKNKGEEGYAVF